VIGVGLLLAALVAAGLTAVWFVPSVQTLIIKNGMVAAFTKAKALPFLSDKNLHVFFCGTGSPMPDLTRAGACLAIIAGGRVVVIDAGPGFGYWIARSLVGRYRFATLARGAHLRMTAISCRGRSGVSGCARDV